MTYNVFSGTLNPTHSLISSLSMMLNTSLGERPAIANCLSSTSATTSLTQLLVDLVLLLLVVLASSLSSYRLMPYRTLQTNRRPHTRHNTLFHDERLYEKVPAGAEAYR